MTQHLPREPREAAIGAGLTAYADFPDGPIRAALVEVAKAEAWRQVPPETTRTLIDALRASNLHSGIGESGVMDVHALFAAQCKATARWGVLMHFTYGDESDFTKPFVSDKGFYGDLLLAAPDLRTDDATQAISDGYAFFFGTSDEIHAIYERTVGDDGPSAANTYDGPVRVYALTCDDHGEFMNENT